MSIPDTCSGDSSSATNSNRAILPALIGWLKFADHVLLLSLNLGFLLRAGIVWLLEMGSCNAYLLGYL